jgi:hypothetical protein
MSCTKLLSVYGIARFGVLLALFVRIHVLLGCDTVLLGEWFQTLRRI